MDGLSPKPAPGQLALVQAFVNTRNIMHGYDLLEDAEGAAAWLSEHGFVGEYGRVSEEDRRSLIAFREGLRGVLLTHNDGSGGKAGVEDLNELASSALLRVRFDSDGEPDLRPAAGGVEGAMSRILAVVVGAAGEGSWRRLKACRNEGCRWVFYDASKNRSGTWCTMDVCGARAKMRAYRQRESSQEE